jgi:hypothetical protein
VFAISQFLHHDDLCHRNRQSHTFSQTRCEQLVGEHAQMLRIILELYHVEVAVIGAHQVRLRTSAHPSHVLDNLNWHGEKRLY